METHSGGQRVIASRAWNPARWNRLTFLADCEHVCWSDMTDITQVLSLIEQGDHSAADQLLPLVYDELRKLAAAKLAHEKPGQTLQATALVHEAYIRLVGDSVPDKWDGRGHFFAAAAESMRRILIDQARHKQTEKAGGGYSTPMRTTLEGCLLTSKRRCGPDFCGVTTTLPYSIESVATAEFSLGSGRRQTLTLFRHRNWPQRTRTISLTSPCAMG